MEMLSVLSGAEAFHSPFFNPVFTLFCPSYHHQNTLVNPPHQSAFLPSVFNCACHKIVYQTVAYQPVAYEKGEPVPLGNRGPPQRHHLLQHPGFATGESRHCFVIGEYAGFSI